MVCTGVQISSHVMFLTRPCGKPLRHTLTHSHYTINLKLSCMNSSPKKNPPSLRPISIKKHSSHSALGEAILGGHVQQVIFLMSLGCLLEESIDSGLWLHTALRTFCAESDGFLYDLLTHDISPYPSINLPDKEKHTVLYLALHAAKKFKTFCGCSSMVLIQISATTMGRHCSMMCLSSMMSL